MKTNSELITSLYGQHTQLDEKTLKELKVLYLQLFNNELPDRCSRQFLIGNISWAIQAGNQHKRLRSKLVKLVINQNISTKTSYLSGTRLIREWRGITHEVVVVENGYRWQQQTYKSLSHIAREITGARWSGPRFFGINK